MIGLDWDGPGVLLMASDRLSAAQLDFEARRYDFRDMADLRANFAPSLALTTVIETRAAPGRKDGYVLIAAPDWMQAIQELFGEWTPEQELRALAADGHHAAITHGDHPQSDQPSRAEPPSAR